jgi:anhydro-N-acetylmuramic acid kinase
VTAEHGDALARFVSLHGAPDVVGFHGQTVFHAPARSLTIQLGDGAAIADRLGVRVVFDLRAADVAAGGEGAPLVPAYHRALVRQAGLAEPVLVINLGGVANVTFVDGETLLAFDTGPASAMVDDAMAAVGRAYDAGGAVAAAGRVDATALARLLDHPYFSAPPPKSLDRNAFSPAPVAGLAFADRVATLTRFSAEAIGRAVDRLPRRPATVIAAGGGTHNATLMRWIAEAVGRPVTAADAAGFSSDHMEAEAFAYLAVRSLRGLPLTFPGTTGVAAPVCGGRLAVPRQEAAGRAVSSR